MLFCLKHNKTDEFITKNKFARFKNNYHTSNLYEAKLYAEPRFAKSALCQMRLDYSAYTIVRLKLVEETFEESLINYVQKLKFPSEID